MSDGLLVRSPPVLWRRSFDRILALAPDGELVILEGTAIDLWELLTEPLSEAALAHVLADRYSAPVDRVLADVSSATRQLLALGVIIEQEP